LPVSFGSNDILRSDYFDFTRYFMQLTVGSWQWTVGNNNSTIQQFNNSTIQQFSAFYFINSLYIFIPFLKESNTSCLAPFEGKLPEFLSQEIAFSRYFIKYSASFTERIGLLPTITYPGLVCAKAVSGLNVP
jgi:hypothetical protein